MAEKRTLFGTDGIRGRANQDPLTPELALAFGRAVAFKFGGAEAAGGRAKIVIGRDTRRSGPMLENAVAAGIASLGVDVVLLGVVPTPAIAFLARHLQASAGIVISASHNSFEDNGLKIFQGNGLKCDDAIEAELSALISGDALKLHRALDERIGDISLWPDAAARYAALAVARYGKGLDLSGLRVVVDAANGAAFATTPAVLRALGAEVMLLHAQPDGININAQCGSTHPESMQAAVRETDAQLGLAHDGDADRLICCDETGALLDGDEMLAVLGLDLLRRGLLAKNTLVATVMSNLGLDDCLQAAGGKVVRSAVGDRYVLELMQAQGLNLGGEQSGHMILWDHNTTGDGLVTALELLRVMRLRQKPLSQLRTGLRKYPQKLVNIPVRERIPLDQLPEITEAVAAVEAELGNQGRVLLRYSGTEPKLRLLVEVREEAKLELIVERLLKPIRKNLG